MLIVYGVYFCIRNIIRTYTWNTNTYMQIHMEHILCDMHSLIQTFVEHMRVRRCIHGMFQCKEFYAEYMSIYGIHLRIQNCMQMIFVRIRNTFPCIAVYAESMSLYRIALHGIYLHAHNSTYALPFTELYTAHRRYVNCIWNIFIHAQLHTDHMSAYGFAFGIY